MQLCVFKVTAKQIQTNAVPGLDSGMANQDFALYMYNVQNTL